MLKKIAKITGITLGVLLLAAFAIPYFFKDQIKARIEKALNESVNAKVSKATKVSPSKGALLMIAIFSILTVAFGKFRKRLTSASAKDTLALTLSLSAFSMRALI